jgi:hypothetical protein
LSFSFGGVGLNTRKLVPHEGPLLRRLSSGLSQDVCAIRKSLSTSSLVGGESLAGLSGDLQLIYRQVFLLFNAFWARNPTQISWRDGKVAGASFTD